MTQASFWRISHIQATSLGTTGQKRLREDGAGLNRGLVAAVGEKLACLRWVNTVLGNSKSAIALVRLTGLWMQPALVTGNSRAHPRRLWPWAQDAPWPWPRSTARRAPTQPAAGAAWASPHRSLRPQRPSAYIIMISHPRPRFATKL